VASVVRWTEARRVARSVLHTDEAVSHVTILALAHVTRFQIFANSVLTTISAANLIGFIAFVDVRTIGAVVNEAGHAFTVEAAGLVKA
jgi:hypothetical protein